MQPRQWRRHHVRHRTSIRIRRARAARATELYITAEPAPGEVHRQALELYADIARSLRDSGAKILQERVFFARGAAQAVRTARAEAFGDLDDGVPPAFLHVSPGVNGPVAGAQVHAIVCNSGLEKIEIEGLPCGRVFRDGEYAFLTVSGLSAGDAGAPAAQAKRMLEKAEQAVSVIGGSMLSVARTWMWLADMLSWYDKFNKVRNEFFNARGLLGSAQQPRLPASTGIGAAPAGGEACAMDMVATVAPDDAVKKRLLASADQGSATEYGSAFSRAVMASCPAASAVYVSGTAAIDRTGRTEHVGDAAGQVADTVAHARTVLGEMGCADRDVVQAVAYCRTQAVERIFREQWANLGWPRVTCVCDICRPNLDFEIEAAAWPGSGD